MWHNGEARDRESGDVMLAVMKTLANLERQRTPQEAGGQVRGQVQGSFVRLPVASQGVKTGERVVVELLGGYQRELQDLRRLGHADEARPSSGRS